MVFKRFFKALQYAAAGFRRQSTLVTTYYYDVLNWKTKADTRFTLLVVMGLLMLHIAEYGLASSVPSAFPFGTVVFLVVSTFLIHLLTFRKLTHATYTNISLLIALGTIWLNCWARCHLARRSTRMYLPTFLLIFITVLLLPIPFDSGLIIVVGQCVTLLLLREHENEQVRKIAKHRNHTKEHHPMVDTFRLSDTPNTALKSSSLMLGQEILLCALIYSVAVYIAMWNQLRRRFVFNRLATNVRMRKAMTKALDDKVRWIQAIMPSQVTAEFYQLYKQYSENDSHMWVYNKALDNVTILFADMVGFTRMSSNKTATQLVMLLNDLFSRFDELCQLTHCEKIGTLGDCYYCVAGCPEPRADHAESCVEMGLGMCRIIKVFNCDHSEQVNMRVGIHTGRVNAAIIGKQRFRYDVYSYDVSIANAMESSGRPGRVHISEETFERVKHVYNVSCGEDLYVKKEEMLGIAGMALTERAMKTYFVDPRSSLIRRRHEKFGKNTNVLSKASWIAQLDDDFDKSSSSAEDDGFETKQDSTIKNSKQPFRTPLSKCREKNKDDLEHLERQIELIHDLQTDPERQIAFFRVPPLHPYLFEFLNAEIEWHYRHHCREIRTPTYIDAKKASSIADACVLAIVNAIVLTVCAVIQIVCVQFDMLDLVIYTSVFVTVITLFFALLLSATFYQDQLKPVTAGIIGTTKPFYDIWGDTVNVASRMYSTGLPGEIQVPETVIPVLEYYFDFHYRGDIFVKDKVTVQTVTDAENYDSLMDPKRGLYASCQLSSMQKWLHQTYRILQMSNRSKVFALEVISFASKSKQKDILLRLPEVMQRTYKELRQVHSPATSGVALFGARRPPWV
ncbi:adenylate cyclase 9 [Clonorchis sinensis]|uniref:adenylate cyclase n=1 Tax=Clonorchis sinensis TaxID=79923 RepID=G7Y3G3_CLOSI|nr:adenylate cyclase 9 [Clonorchis sinensis]